MTKQIHRVIVLWTNLCRLVLGAVFLFSGFTKSIDPLGFFYKLQDYLTAFGGANPVGDIGLLIAAILLSALELVTGIFLLLDVRRPFAITAALALMIVMTPLTFYLALANPVSDCGCFGDAWVLTNWQTFGKNVCLLAAAVSVVKWRTCLIKFISTKNEWIVSTYTFIYVFALSFYCLKNLPLIDFRPYRIGVNLHEAMIVPEGVERPVYDDRFVLSKDGVQREFTLDDYPDSTWTFVETRHVLKKPGYIPPLADFSLSDADTGQDITDSVLTAPGYTFLLVAHNLETASDAYIDLINEVYDYSVDYGYAFYALTASTDRAIRRWRAMTGAEYPFCQSDDIALKTMIRSNPGLMLLRDGVVIGKWSDSSLPTEYQLTDRLENLPMGQLTPFSLARTLGYVTFWFFVPLLLVIVADVWWTRNRKREKIDVVDAVPSANPKQMETLSDLSADTSSDSPRDNE